jgi:hypothetical protein
MKYLIDHLLITMYNNGIICKIKAGEAVGW